MQNKMKKNSFWRASYSPRATTICTPLVDIRFSELDFEAKSANVDLFDAASPLGAFPETGKGMQVFCLLKKIIKKNGINTIYFSPVDEMREKLYALWARRNGWAVKKIGARHFLAYQNQ